MGSCAALPASHSSIATLSTPRQRCVFRRRSTLRAIPRAGSAQRTRERCETSQADPVAHSRLPPTEQLPQTVPHMRFRKRKTPWDRGSAEDALAGRAGCLRDGQPPRPPMMQMLASGRQAPSRRPPRGLPDHSAGASLTSSGGGSDAGCPRPAARSGCTVDGMAPQPGSRKAADYSVPAVSRRYTTTQRRRSAGLKRHQPTPGSTRLPH